MKLILAPLQQKVGLTLHPHPVIEIKHNNLSYLINLPLSSFCCLWHHAQGHCCPHSNPNPADYCPNHRHCPAVGVPHRFNQVNRGSPVVRSRILLINPSTIII